MRFITRQKIVASDKFMVAYDALALSEIWHDTPPIGQILHGEGLIITRFSLVGPLNQVRRVLRSISDRFTKDIPSPILKKHCLECEFQSRCRRLAVEKDDLSLLGNFSEKERKKQHDKGVFTVTQLSYMFKPRRRSSKKVVTKFEPSLRALAIRKNQIHVVGSPALTKSGTSVYFDVEGDTDRNFYYLIGLRILSAESHVYHSFWADDPSFERGMWLECLDVLSRIPNPQLIHCSAANG
jgi:predicted RecB family nuclease